jgi:hypothetical protein
MISPFQSLLEGGNARSAGSALKCHEPKTLLLIMIVQYIVELELHLLALFQF